MMTLVDEAERAEKIRNAFIFFCDPLKEHITDLNKAISELSSLGCVLREIDKLIELDDGVGLELIREDLQYVHEDVTFTLGDIWQSLGCLGRGHTVEDYQTTWDEICEQAEDSSDGNSLHVTLERYKRFLEGLCKKLESHMSTPTVENMRDQIHDINARNKKRPVSTSRQSTQSTKTSSARLTRSNSFRQPTQGAQSTKTFPTKTKPNVTRTNSSKQTQSLSRKTSLRVTSPQSPTLKKSYERERPWSPTDSAASSATDATRFRDKPPWAPTPPLSPSATMSSISAVSSVDSDATLPKHWAKSVFTNLSSTNFTWSDEETRYHEQRNTKEHTYPNGEYDSVLKLQYPEGVRITLYCRANDYRAKIVALYRDHTGNQDYGCLPLEDLHIRREGSVLRLCRRSSTGKSIRWVSMKFTTIEWLVLFTGTFIAMRSQDSTSNPVPPVIDSILANEECEFAGRIIDSGFSHALCIYRDTITGAIRLQASVLGGELDRTPVWTAFVTHAIGSEGWCRRVDRRTVALDEIQLHVFSSRYRTDSNSKFMVRFETRGDAEAFLEVVELLGEEVGGL